MVSDSVHDAREKTVPVPGWPAPALDMATVGGGRFRLDACSPELFTLVVFYRGLHSLSCRAYVQRLSELRRRYETQGVAVVAASMDGEERASRACSEWGIEGLVVGHSIDVGQALGWGLFLSTAVSPQEPPRFCEPGLYLVQPDHVLYAAIIGSAPFGRPDLDELLAEVALIREHRCPARGVAG